MNVSQIAVRYAKAFYLAARDAGKLEEAFRDINLIQSVIQDNPEFRDVLDSPIITEAEKINVLKNSFYPHVQSLTAHFLDVILQNNREVFLPDIARDFIDQYKKQQGITYAQLTTTKTIGRNIVEKIKKRLSERLKSDIQLATLTDPEIIGGFILNIEDVRFDASVRSALQNMKKELTRTK
ncbi:MAG TPA: ATP synthase F1 subunit delta [Bacteroidetes bacterium]|nr:ATP synthase F1 subunit delta [Bacteroidota bacterium]